jgi:hypothetical protein
MSLLRGVGPNGARTEVWCRRTGGVSLWCPNRRRGWAMLGPGVNIEAYGEIVPHVGM